MSFTHMKGDAMWGHGADLASCLACPECHDMQAAAVLQVVNAANALSQDTESPRSVPLAFNGPRRFEDGPIPPESPEEPA